MAEHTPHEQPSARHEDDQRPVRNVPIVAVQLQDKTLTSTGTDKPVLGAMVDFDVDTISYAELYLNNMGVRLIDDVAWGESQVMALFLGYATDISHFRRMGIYHMSMPQFDFKFRNRIVIRAFGDGIGMTRVQKRRVFENMTYGQIAEQICRENELEPVIEPDLAEEVPSMTQAGVTDYQFMKDLAFRTGLDFFVAEGRLHLSIPSRRANETPLPVNVDESTTRSVIFEVHAEGEAAVLKSSPVNPRTGEFEDIATQFSADGFLDIANDPTQVRFSEMATPRLVFIDGRGNLLSKTSLQTIVDSEGNWRKQIVKVRASMDGNEMIRPRSFAVFINAGQRFRGPYYITKVKHTITGNDFVTSFEGIRATTGAYREVFAFGVNADEVGGTPLPLRDVSNLSEVEVA